MIFPDHPSRKFRTSLDTIVLLFVPQLKTGSSLV